jgi:hypothetical protein
MWSLKETGLSLSSALDMPRHSIHHLDIWRGFQACVWLQHHEIILHAAAAGGCCQKKKVILSSTSDLSQPPIETQQIPQGPDRWVWSRGWGRASVASRPYTKDDTSRLHATIQQACKSRLVQALHSGNDKGVGAKDAMKLKKLIVI